MNAKSVKKNVAGYVDEQGRFRPIRSPQFVGSRKATAKDRRKYSPAKAGDLGKAKQERALEAPWDTDARLEREAAERKKRDQDRIMREIESDAYGDGDTRSKGRTLMQFVRAQGGVRRTFRFGGKKGVGKYGKRSSWDSGEIDRLSFKETGKRGLTTDGPNRGKTLDKMFQGAKAEGYDVTSIDDMMERVEAEAAGHTPTYATHGSLAYNPKQKMRKPKKNPIGIAEFAQLASGIASTLQVSEMLNRKPAAKKRKKTTRRKNPGRVGRPASGVRSLRLSTPKTPRLTANPRKQVAVPAKGDFYLLTIGSGDDVMAVYLQDGDKDGFSKRFKTVAAAKSYATKKRLRLKANPTPVVLKRNVAGFVDGAGIFHPIRGSADYSPLAAGDRKSAPRRRADAKRNLIAAAKKAKTQQQFNDAVIRLTKKEGLSTAAALRLTGSFKSKRKTNPERRVVGKAAKPVSESYYLNPFMDGVYLSHGTTLGRKFATQAAARKFAREKGIRLANPVVSGQWSVVSKKNPPKRNGVNKLFGKTFSQIAATAKRIRKTSFNVPAFMTSDAHAWISKNGGSLANRDGRLVLTFAKHNPAPRLKTPKTPRTKFTVRNPMPKAKSQKPKANPPRRPTFEKFQGRRVTQAKRLEVSRLAPARLDQLGDLVGFKLMDENRERVCNPAKLKLCAANGRLWIAGGRVARPDASMPATKLNPIGHLDYVVYKTHKPHHGDAPGQHYIHQLGEEGGTLPLLTVDRDGFAVLKGGQYKIQAEGIRD